VSVDYLLQPLEVFAEVCRVVRRGGPFVCTFSNRVFPTKVIRGWMVATDEGRADIVAGYFRASGGWEEPVVERRTPAQHRGDPLFAVWAHRAGRPTSLS
jgi:SAM-dependent methyltransferase